LLALGQQKDLESSFFWLHERTGTEQLDQQRVIETGVVIVVIFLKLVHFKRRHISVVERLAIL